MNEKLSNYICLNRIEFIVTNNCSANCKHCSEAENINCKHSATHINSNVAGKAIFELSKCYDIKSVMTFGGEPLLYHKTTCAIHKKTFECGIPVRQIITNGYFTKDSSVQKRVAQNLKESHVNSLLISVDSFHQETIPINIVYNFVKFALEAGVEGIKLSPAWVVNEAHDNKYNIETHKILNYFSDLNLPVSSGNNISLSGNARKYLADYYDNPKLDLSLKCGQEPYSEPLTNIKSISIAPNGDVMICSFIVGNIYSESIIDILKRYNPYENKYMQAIMSGGISSLLKLVQKNGIDIDLSNHYSSCDVCNILVKKSQQKNK